MLTGHPPLDEVEPPLLEDELEELDDEELEELLELDELLELLEPDDELEEELELELLLDEELEDELEDDELLDELDVLPPVGTEHSLTPPPMRPPNVASLQTKLPLNNL